MFILNYTIPSHSIWIQLNVGARIGEGVVTLFCGAVLPEAPPAEAPRRLPGLMALVFIRRGNVLATGGIFITGLGHTARFWRIEVKVWSKLFLRNSICQSWRSAPPAAPRTGKKARVARRT